jgi:hypothetical protein
MQGVNASLVPPRGARALAQTMGWKSRRLAEERDDVHKVNAVILQSMGLA